MRVAAKNEQSDRADQNFNRQKRKIAEMQQMSHQRIAFFGEIVLHPKERKNGVEKIQSEQPESFGEDIVSRFFHIGN